MLADKLKPENFTLAFTRIDQLLVKYQHIWRPQPFIEDELLWQIEHQSLYNNLLALSVTELEQLENEEFLQQWISHYLPELTSLSCWQIEAYNGQLMPMAKFSDTSIPGRKKQQIIGFSSATFATQNINGSIVDWCSGKGYLARHLHNLSKQKVYCLEYNKQLCTAGQAQASAQGSDIHFIQQNVLQDIAPELISDAALHTALHACGDLHVAMLKTAVDVQAKHIACSPCCYQLRQHDVYQPLSQLGQSTALSLSKTDLRLAVLQTVTGGQRVKRLREQELIWRIAFDLLRRQITGQQHYEPTPSISKAHLSGSFIDYVRYVADKIQLTVPQEIDTEGLITLAKQKYGRICRLDKARLAFRKAMEYWLLLDLAIYLQEAGYKVQLCQFCEEKISPRNTLMLASRLEQ